MEIAGSVAGIVIKEIKYQTGGNLVIPNIVYQITPKINKNL